MNDIIVGFLTTLTHTLGGSLGCAIIVLSLGIRVALLPLTIGLARRARRNQEMIRILQPDIEQLKKRFENKPERLFQEMRQLYQKHGCSPFDLLTLAGSFIQLPIFAILYQSIRGSLSTSSTFLWIKNLASSDFFLTLLILSLTGVSAYLMPSASAQMKNALIVLQIIVTFFIIWKLAAGLGLYWASSSLVALFQTVWLRWSKDSRMPRSLLH